MCITALKSHCVLLSLHCCMSVMQGEETGWRKVLLYDRLMKNQSSTDRASYYALMKHYEDSFSLK